MDEHDKQSQPGNAAPATEEDVKRIGTKEDIRGPGADKDEAKSESQDRLRDGTKS